MSCKKQWIAGTIVSVAIATHCAASQVETSLMCDRAAVRAARAEQIPQNVLLAVTRLESGRAIKGKTRPWPWTANVAGKGRYFDTEDELRQHLFRVFKTGKRNFDVGCFQINYRWHSDKFGSLDEMIDPDASATYAARFLKQLYKETGDWTLAVGAYHSRTPKYAQRYRKKYLIVSRNLPDIPENGPTSIAAATPDTNRGDIVTRTNSFALLSGGTGSTAGSLVPLGNGLGLNLLGR